MGHDGSRIFLTASSALRRFAAIWAIAVPHMW
jgi:hypothetical protein